MKDLLERAETEGKRRGSRIALKGMLLLMGAFLVFAGAMIIFAEIQNTLGGRTTPLGSTFIIGLAILIAGLGIVLQATIGPTLKQLKDGSVKRQLEDMKMIKDSAGNRKARRRD